MKHCSTKSTTQCFILMASRYQWLNLKRCKKRDWSIQSNIRDNTPSTYSVYTHYKHYRCKVQNKGFLVYQLNIVTKMMMNKKLIFMAMMRMSWKLERLPCCSVIFNLMKITCSMLIFLVATIFQGTSAQICYLFIFHSIVCIHSYDNRVQTVIIDC